MEKKKELEKTYLSVALGMNSWLSCLQLLAVSDRLCVSLMYNATVFLTLEPVGTF